MFENMWKDPVWSKVISAVIIAAGGFMISILYSLITDLTVKDSILYLWNLKITLGPTFIIVFLLTVSTSVIKQIRTRKRKEGKSLENKFHEKYNKIIDEENRLIYRFNAYIGLYDKFPFVSGLRVYCNSHDTEVLLTEYQGCNRSGCKHFGIGYDEIKVKQGIETYLLGEWEKMKA